MAVEDKKYEEVVASINALMATGRTEMVRGWLISIAIAILTHYGYEIEKR